MVDAPRPDPAAPWPVAFTGAFVQQVRGLLDVRPVLAIIGPVGGNRNLLAALVVDAPDGAVRWRHIARYGDRDRPYFAARQILLSLHVAPDAGPADVEAAAVEALRDSGLHHGTLVLGNADLCDPESLSLMARLAVRGGDQDRGDRDPRDGDEPGRPPAGRGDRRAPTVGRLDHR